MVKYLYALILSYKTKKRGKLKLINLPLLF
nr:MAG TPA: hypothetical protein [Caudoviricetes sp.]